LTELGLPVAALGDDWFLRLRKNGIQMKQMKGMAMITMTMTNIAVKEIAAEGEGGCPKNKRIISHQLY